MNDSLSLSYSHMLILVVLSLVSECVCAVSTRTLRRRQSAHSHWFRSHTLSLMSDKKGEWEWEWERELRTFYRWETFIGRWCFGVREKHRIFDNDLFLGANEKHERRSTMIRLVSAVNDAGKHIWIHINWFIFPLRIPNLNILRR